MNRKTDFWNGMGRGLLAILLLPMLLIRSPKERIQAVYGGAIRLFRRVIFLDGIDIAKAETEWQIRALRLALKVCLIPALVLGGILAVRWPVARAQALRIFMERHLAQTAVAAEAYKVGVSDVTTLALQAAHEDGKTEEERASNFLRLAAVQTELEAHRQAMLQASQAAIKAQKALPARLYDSTAWVDPITGQAFRADATRPEIAAALVDQGAHGGDFRGWLNLVRTCVNQGAPALPDLAETAASQPR